MSVQISLRMSEEMFSNIKQYAKMQGYESIQDFIKESLRQQLYEEPADSRYHKLKEALRGIRFLTKEEQKARNKEFETIRMKKGLKAAQDYLWKKVGL